LAPDQGGSAMAAVAAEPADAWHASVLPSAAEVAPAGGGSSRSSSSNPEVAPSPVRPAPASVDVAEASRREAAAAAVASMAAAAAVAAAAATTPQQQLQPPQQQQQQQPPQHQLPCCGSGVDASLSAEASAGSPSCEPCGGLLGTAASALAASPAVLAERQRVEVLLAEDTSWRLPPLRAQAPGLGSQHSPQKSTCCADAIGAWSEVAREGTTPTLAVCRGSVPVLVVLGSAGDDAGTGTRTPVDGILAYNSEDEPPVCPDEDSALVQRIRPMQQVQPTPSWGETDTWHQAAKALEIDDRDSGWNGRVAIERSDGPRPPLTGPRVPPGGGPGLLGATGSGFSASATGYYPLAPGAGGGGRRSNSRSGSCSPGPGLRDSKLDHARRQLQTAMQALEACDMHVRAHVEDLRQAEAEARARQEADLRASELEELKAEVGQLKRDLLRMRGVPKELGIMEMSSLHQLQQDLSESLRSVHGELEARAKCCVCREVERQVLLRPCQHLALCHGCARRVDRCPLCRSNIERYEAVCVA